MLFLKSTYGTKEEEKEAEFTNLKSQSLVNKTIDSIVFEAPRAEAMLGSGLKALLDLN